jgi:hypothetical protein
MWPLAQTKKGFGMIHALQALWDLVVSHWKLVGGTVFVGAIAAAGVKVMGLLKSWNEFKKARYEALDAKTKYQQTERKSLGLKATIPTQRKLTDQQRTIIAQTIKNYLSNDQPTPYPCWRSVRIITFPIEDCQSFAFQIANAISQGGLSTPMRAQGMDTSEENSLYEKGIWIRGHESPGFPLHPPTEAIILGALNKADIHATLVPSDNMVELIIGTAEP